MILARTDPDTLKLDYVEALTDNELLKEDNT
jgi:hypothetical protein